MTHSMKNRSDHTRDTYRTDSSCCTQTPTLSMHTYGAPIIIAPSFLAFSGFIVLFSTIILL